MFEIVNFNTMGIIIVILISKINFENGLQKTNNIYLKKKTKFKENIHFAKLASFSQLFSKL